MTREELILDCRYYNGEEDFPASLPESKGYIWSLERIWVYSCLNQDIPEDIIRGREYEARIYNLDMILPDDGTPLSLKSFLLSDFLRYKPDLGYVPEFSDEFRSWYIREYLANTKTHRQLLTRL